MGLEILVRIGYFLVNKAESVYISLKPSIKGPVLDILQNGKTAVFNCLQDMRKVLGVINTQNENIVTQSISNFTIRGEEAIYRGSSNGWLDICKEYFCIHLPEDDVFLRIKYHSVKAFESKSHRVLEFSVSWEIFYLVESID